MLDKVLKNLPISDSTSESEKPAPKQCEHCGEEVPQLFLEIPLKGPRWVYCACPCEEERDKKFWEDQKRREKQRKIRDILKLSSSYEQLQSYNFDNLKIRPGMEEAYNQVKEALEKFDERGRVGLLIFGESGNGKTHLTASAGNILIDRGYSVIFLTEKDLLYRLRESDHYDNEERFYEIMNACQNADLLIWDDFLSSQRFTKDEKDWIFMIINGRERANKPIWFTSNITEQEFAKSKYAKILDENVDGKERTWGRIIGNTIPVKNHATNYRRLQAIARLNNKSVDELDL